MTLNIVGELFAFSHLIEAHVAHLYTCGETSSLSTLYYEADALNTGWCICVG